MKTLLISLFSVLGVFANAQDTLTVYFNFDIHALTDFQTEMMLMDVDVNSIEVKSIKAYCDTTGSVSYNDKLARRRADFMLKALRLQEQDVVEFEVIGERYQVTNSYKSSDWRKVVVVFDAVEYALAPPPPPPLEEIVEVKYAEESKVIIEYSNDPLEVAIDNFLKSEDTVMVFKLGVNFHPGMSTILPESLKEVDRLVRIMKKNPELNAFIRGHICCSPVDMEMLSEDRAKTILMELIKNNIDKSRLSFQGFGRTMPAVDPEYTEADRIANRRVDVVFTKH